VSDGFNGDGENNRFTVVIANKKAEVGINLQKGTQAVHHLTTGWTPDSIHQRNGRAIRQGNKAERVTVYHYEANGTFDSYKRNLLSVKSDWIGSVLSGGEDDVTIGGSMSRKDMEDMAEMWGDAEAVSRFQAERAKKEQERFAEEARKKQISLLRAAELPIKAMKEYKTAKVYVDNFIKANTDATKAEVHALNRQLVSYRESLEKIQNQTSETAIKNQSRLTARINETQAQINKKNALVRENDKKTSDFYVNQENSAAYQEWKDMIDRNQAVLDQVKVEFGKTKIGYAATAFDQFAAGTANIITGQLLVHDGMIGQLENSTLFVVSGTDGVLHTTKTLSLSGINAQYYDATSPEWDEKIRALAAIDAVELKKGYSGFYVKYLPAISEYLPDDLPIKCRLSDKNIAFKDSNVFKYPRDLKWASSNIARSIKEGQNIPNGPITRSDGDWIWVNKADIITLDAPYTDEELSQAVFDYARLKNIKLGHSAIGTEFGYNATKLIYKKVTGFDSPHAIKEYLSNKSFASKEDIEAYIETNFTAKIMDVYDTNNLVFEIRDVIAEFEKKLALKQYGENVLELDTRAFQTAPPALALDADMRTNGAAYVMDMGDRFVVNVETALATLKAKEVDGEGSERYLCVLNGATYLFYEAALKTFIIGSFDYKEAVKAIQMAKCPPGLDALMQKINAVSGVRSVQLLTQTIHTEKSKFKGPATYAAYTAILVETDLKGYASSKVRGSGMHFEYNVTPKAWIASFEPGANKKTVADMMQLLGI
jgi:hypothetical protein